MTLADRAPRDLSTRDKDQRKRSWKPPSILPDPPSDEQYRYKWVRTALGGQSDPTNVNSKLREGWELVPPDDPAAAGIRQAADTKGHFSGSVEIGGLALARMPSEMAAERDAYFSQSAKKQAEGVENSYLRENDSRMPILPIEKASKINGNKTG